MLAKIRSLSSFRFVSPTRWWWCVGTLERREELANNLQLVGEDFNHYINYIGLVDGGLFIFRVYY